MPRAPFICGNWKMFTNARTARDLAAAIADGVTGDAVRVAVCPPFPYLTTVAQALDGSKVALGGQNLYPAMEGAFTGEVSPAMLKDVGCRYVIVGHSERRHGLGESNAFINQKVHAGLSAGLDVILCIGETLAERQAGQMQTVLQKQLSECLVNFEATQIDRLTIAYEPVWAIGTGHNATPAQAQEANRFIRSWFAERFDQSAAAQLIIQYGGSAKPENAQAILHQPDVDGALVGGASLKAETFLAVIALAAA